MHITKLIVLSGLAAFFLLLLLHRLSSGKRYVNLLGLVSVIFFGFLHIVFEQEFAPLFVAGGLQEFLTADQIKQTVGVCFWLSFAYFINALIKSFVYPRRLTWQGDSKMPLLLQYVVTVVLYLTAFMMIVGVVFGQSLTGVLAASGAVALVIGYSARTMVDEVFAGLSININAPFEKGDLIQIDGEWGYVKDIDWRSITYLDMDNNYVVVPNTKVAASKIRNLDRPNVMTRRTMFIQVEYNIPPQIVVEQCNAAISECPHIAPHPWNFASYFDCDEKGMRYKLHFHVAHYDNWYVGSDELLNAIWYRFARKGIRFAHQRNLNFTSSKDEARGMPESAYDDANWRSLVERFQQVPMFEGLTSEDMEELARSAKLHVIGPPERIIRTGSQRTSMFLIAFGSADVYAVNDDESESWLATVGVSETLGLMSLLTGTPQRTTIRAKEESAVWEISSESLHAIFERKPGVMDAIAGNVARWQAEEDQAIQAIEMSKHQETQYIRQRKNRLSDRISSFFQREVEVEEESNEEFTNF